MAHCDSSSAWYKGEPYSLRQWDSCDPADARPVVNTNVLTELSPSDFASRSYQPRHQSGMDQHQQIGPTTTRSSTSYPTSEIRHPSLRSPPLSPPLLQPPLAQLSSVPVMERSPSAPQPTKSQWPQLTYTRPPYGDGGRRRAVSYGPPAEYNGSLYHRYVDGDLGSLAPSQGPGWDRASSGWATPSIEESEPSWNTNMQHHTEQSQMPPYSSFQHHVDISPPSRSPPSPPHMYPTPASAPPSYRAYPGTPSDWNTLIGSDRGRNQYQSESLLDLSPRSRQRRLDWDLAGVDGFLQRSTPTLTVLLSRPQFQAFIRWADDGSSFLFAHDSVALKATLGVFFRHSNVASFVRQLNIYGFARLSPPANAWPGQQGGVSSFWHPLFTRGGCDIGMLKPKTAPKKRKKKGSSSAAEEDM
ncbi:hypothetical protein T439DRAFT_321134 [Meredithblackwellia eburnea MCA 4105]